MKKILLRPKVMIDHCYADEVEKGDFYIARDPAGKLCGHGYYQRSLYRWSLWRGDGFNDLIFRNTFEELVEHCEKDLNIRLYKVE